MLMSWQTVDHATPVLLVAAADQQYTLVAAVLMVLVDPQSLSWREALDMSSLTPHGHAAAGALACDWHRWTRTAPTLGDAIPRCAGPSSDALRRPAPLACLSHDDGGAASGADDTDARCLGALCDRALARDDCVLAM
jgi:hypothetical protein